MYMFHAIVRPSPCSMTLIQVGGVTLRLQQDPHSSNTLPSARGQGDGHRQAGSAAAHCDWLIDTDAVNSAGAGGTHGSTQPLRVGAGGAAAGAIAATPQQALGMVSTASSQPHLANVGLVVWQSGVLLAELLLRNPPFGPWGPHVHVMDLGAGTGLVGLALAAAGASVTLTDLAHILPLARANAAANLPAGAPVVITEYAWGTDPQLLLQQAGGRPDVITGADLLYDTALHAALLASLCAVCAPHTLVFLAYRKRSKAEEGFAAAAEAAGFAVEQVPDAQLQEEYQGGAYCVLRLARRDPVAGAVGGVQDPYSSPMHSATAAGLQSGSSSAGLARSAVTVDHTSVALGQDSGPGGNGRQQQQEEKKEQECEELEHKPCVQS